MVLFLIVEFVALIGWILVQLFDLLTGAIWVIGCLLVALSNLLTAVAEGDSKRRLRY